MSGKPAAELRSEIVYSQEPYDQAVDYSSWYRAWPTNFEPIKEWQPLEDARPEVFQPQARLLRGYIQVISIVAREEPAIGWSPDDSTLALYERVKKFRPLPVDDEFEVCLGKSKKRAASYMRFFGPPRSITPYHFSHEIFDQFEEIGAEDSDQFNGEWWVAYLRRLSQSEFEGAYRRIADLEDAISEVSNRMYRLANRYLRNRLEKYVVSDDDS